MAQKGLHATWEKLLQHWPDPTEHSCRHAAIEHMVANKATFAVYRQPLANVLQTYETTTWFGRRDHLFVWDKSQQGFRWRLSSDVLMGLHNTGRTSTTLQLRQLRARTIDRRIKISSSGRETPLHDKYALRSLYWA